MSLDSLCRSFVPTINLSACSHMYKRSASTFLGPDRTKFRVLQWSLKALRGRGWISSDVMSEWRASLMLEPPEEPVNLVCRLFFAIPVF